MDIIRRGVEEIIPEDALVQKLEKSISTGIPLRVKLGCDPSSPDLHLGHTVVLRKLRHFQDLGHQAVLIIGDFTGMIGDPSGRNKTRPSLTLEQTRINGETYFQQASKILIAEKTEIVFNSDWLSKLTFEDVIKLSAKYTVARMLERDDFENRYKSGAPISIHEFLYPLAQAMDSVAIRSDVELGGTDQKFNLLVGRDIQREYGQEPQVIITLPILPGTDGVDKMGKSLSNYIGLTEPASEIYGKVLSIPDKLIIPYFKLLTDVPLPEIQEMETAMKDGRMNPRDAKRKLARMLVAMYVDEESAITAEQEFDQIHKKKEVPDNIPECTIPTSKTLSLLELLVQEKMVPSRSEGRRLFQQGGISIDGKKVTDSS
ncbi:MAG: tyrosine--tRNA ligase, partial [Chlorobi bacterium]|nr:tyrosine--tRNA ligase [Chlorobiota bacterium]